MILDTSVLVSAERDERRTEDLLGSERDIAIAAVTLAELIVGTLIGDEARRAQRRAFVEGLVEQLRIEPYTAGVAGEHARLIVATRWTGSVRSAHDLQIAATASHTRRAVVTHDSRGFADLPGVDVRVP